MEIITCTFYYFSSSSSINHRSFHRNMVYRSLQTRRLAFYASVCIHILISLDEYHLLLAALCPSLGPLLFAEASLSCSFPLPAIQDAKSKFNAAAGFAALARGFCFCICSNSARDSGSMFSNRYGIPTIIAREKRAMRIMGFLKKDRIETACGQVSMLRGLYIQILHRERTALPWLVIIYDSGRANLNFHAFRICSVALASDFSFVIPLIAPESLP